MPDTPDTTPSPGASPDTPQSDEMSEEEFFEAAAHLFAGDLGGGPKVHQHESRLTIRMPNRPGQTGAPSISVVSRTDGKDSSMEVNVSGTPETPEEYDALISVISSVI